MTDQTTTPLAGAHVGPIVAISDPAQARAFYEDTLGLQGEDAAGGGRVVRAAGGTVIYLLEVGEEAGTASWPVASFRVRDVRATVSALHGLGVTFRTDLPFDQDELGIADQGDLTVAWMQDPDGNLLTIFSAA